jgi:hypothetical protein
MPARRKPKRATTPARAPAARASLYGRRGVAPDIYPRLSEQAAALRYTGRWHRVRAWAEGALELGGFEEVRPHVIKFARRQNGTRVERLAVSRVRDLDDEEEAYRRALPLEVLDDFPVGPGRLRGGIRRVVITALTWVPDHEFEMCDDAAWITLGWGMTAKQATRRAAEFVRNYDRALHARTNSRELVFTALEVKFWTARQGSTYV